jgi:hypothetical protein
MKNDACNCERGKNSMISTKTKPSELTITNKDVELKSNRFDNVYSSEVCC